MTTCVILNADSYDARIFFDSLVATNHRGLAVNLVNAAPNAAPGAVNLRTQTAQTWSFV